MGLMSTLMDWQGGLMARRQAMQEKMADQLGLTDLLQQRQLAEQQGLLGLQEQMADRANAKEQAAFQKDAKAFALMNPNIGAGGGYRLSQMGDSATSRQQGYGLMGNYSAQHAGLTEEQKAKLAQDQANFDRSYGLDKLRTDAAVAASQAAGKAAGVQANSPGGLYKFMTGSEVPAGYQAVFGPDGPQLRPVKDSEPWKKSVEGVRLAEGSLGRIQSMADDFAEYGTEQLPTATKGRMKANREALIADLAKLQNLGVIQPADYERLAGMLPDPTNVTFIQTDAEVKSSLEFIEKEIEKALAVAYETNPWVPKGEVSMPGGATGRW